MQFVIKLFISICIISLCYYISRKFPSLSGLIAVMPLTGAIIFVIVFSENPNNFEMMAQWTRGAIWGIIPSIFFFIAALFCIKRQLSIPVVLCISFSVWLFGAVIHQWLLRHLGA